MFEVAGLKSSIGDILNGADFAAMGAEGEPFLSGFFPVFVNEDNDMSVPLPVRRIAVDEEISRLSHLKIHFSQGAILMDSRHKLGSQIAFVGEACFAK